VQALVQEQHCFSHLHEAREIATQRVGLWDLVELVDGRDATT
jgi:hypothetical protein